MKPNKKIDREIHEALRNPPKRHGVRGKRKRLTTDKKLGREIHEALHNSRKKKRGVRGSGDPSPKLGARSPTSTSDVRSPTSTSTEVRSPTSTSTDAYTSGNVTVTGGAGAGATTSVKIYPSPKTAKESPRADKRANEYRSRGSQKRMTAMIRATMAPRAPSPMPAIMHATDDRKLAKTKQRDRLVAEADAGSRVRTPKKSPAQLDREIAESLRGGSPRPRKVP